MEHSASLVTIEETVLKVRKIKDIESLLFCQFYDVMEAYRAVSTLILDMDNSILNLILIESQTGDDYSQSIQTITKRINRLRDVLSRRESDLDTLQETLKSIVNYNKAESIGDLGVQLSLPTPNTSWK